MSLPVGALGQPVRLLTSVVCAVLPESIWNLQNLTRLNVEFNALQGIAGYRIKPVRLGHAQLRQYCFYASFETRNQIRTPQTELNGVVLCPKLSSLLLG